ncbi:MAG: hypothetical protein QM749_10925 [Aquabacterium sp.]
MGVLILFVTRAARLRCSFQRRGTTRRKGATHEDLDPRRRRHVRHDRLRKRVDLRVARGHDAVGLHRDPSRIQGTWVFVLESSEVAGAIREECKKDSAGDAAKADACYARIKTQAGKEKIRFAKDASGKMVWRSFGQDEGKEELFLEVPVRLAADGSSHVLAKVAGSAKGFQAEKFQRADVKAVRVEISSTTRRSR